MEVFLFPLMNVTLFPQTTKPLNIFEPKYVAMIKEAVALKKPIAVGFIEDPEHEHVLSIGDGLNFVNQIAGYGIPQIIEERVNGTLLVFLQGQGKVRLNRVLEKNYPFTVCEATVMEENQIVELTQKNELQVIHQILNRWISKHIADPLQREIFLKSIHRPEEVVGAFSSYLVRDYDFQQVILELNNINDKIEIIARLVQSSELLT